MRDDLAPRSEKDGGSFGPVGKLVKGIDRDRRISLDEGNSR